MNYREFTSRLGKALKLIPKDTVRGESVHGHFNFANRLSLNIPLPERYLDAVSMVDIAEMGMSYADELTVNSGMSLDSLNGVNTFHIMESSKHWDIHVSHNACVSKRTLSVGISNGDVPEVSKFTYNVINLCRQNDQEGLTNYLNSIDTLH